MPPLAVDAVILGGGPAGSTAGILLARAGWHVVLVEKAPFPRPKVCGEFLSATNWRLLAELGVHRDVESLGGPPVRRVGLLAEADTLTAPMPRVAGAGDGWGRALGRDVLDTLLLDAARRAGADVLQPWKVDSVSSGENGFTVSLVHRGAACRTLQAPIVIAAHGSWERNPLPGASDSGPPRDADLLGFKAHFANSALPGDLMPLLLFPGGYGGMVHTGAGQTGLSCCVRRDRLGRIRQAYPGLRAGEALEAHLRATVQGVGEMLAGSVRTGPWLAAGPIRPGIRLKAAPAGLFLVGNAAGEAHPAIAEGISMAMQSSALLCRCLLRADTRESPAARVEAGQHYQRAWRQAFARRIAVSSLIAGLSGSEPLLHLALPLARRFPRALTLGAALSGKRHILIP